MNEDLRLTGNQYNVVLSIFFVTYILFGNSLTSLTHRTFLRQTVHLHNLTLEMPSNYILERYFTQRPSWWIAFIAVAWGVLMTLVCLLLPLYDRASSSHLNNSTESCRTSEALSLSAS